MTRYHVGSDGAPKPCNAQPGNCPLGGEHFDNLENAERYAETKNEAEARGDSGSFTHSSGVNHWVEVESTDVNTEENGMGGEGERYYTDFDLSDNKEAKRLFDNADRLYVSADVDRRAEVTVSLEDGTRQTAEFSELSGDGDVLESVVDYIREVQREEDEPSVDEVKIQFAWVGHSMQAEVIDDKGDVVEDWFDQAEGLDFDPPAMKLIAEDVFLNTSKIRKDYKVMLENAESNLKDTFAWLTVNRWT